MKKKQKVIQTLLGSKVTTVSSNSLDKLLRIEVNGRWFVETRDPNEIFGQGNIHKISKKI